MLISSLTAFVPAHADEYKDTLKILRDKNILSQKEYNDKLKEYEEKEENKK